MSQKRSSGEYTHHSALITHHLRKEGEGMLNALRNLFDDNAREVKRLQKTVDNINEFEPYIRSLSDDEL